MHTIAVEHQDDLDDDPGDLADAIRALSDTDLLRLETIARLRARGLPGFDWPDLLNEAILRSLEGARHRPEGIPVVAFLAMTMRSVADAHWRRLRLDRRTFVSAGRDGPDQVLLLPDDSAEADPERAAAGRQALAALDALFAQDIVALTIMAGLAEGLTAVEIKLRHGLNHDTYDAARKRMRRALLRNRRAGAST